MGTAPDVQVTLLDGEIPATMTLDVLKSHIPTSWKAQRKILNGASWNHLKTGPRFLQKETADRN